MDPSASITSQRVRQRGVLYLFDIDGTLLLSGGVGRMALARAFELAYGVAQAMDGITLSGRTDLSVIAEMFDRVLARPPTQEEVERFLSGYVPVLAEHLRDAPGFEIMPAVLETLDFLAGCGDVTLAVATGNIRHGAQAKLERAGLWHRFSEGGGFGDDSAERGELVAAAIKRARDAIGPFADERIVVVGDTPHDVSAARACGVRVIAVTTGGYSRDQLAATGPDAIFDSLAELPDWHRRHMDHPAATP